jgi:hypothetical protein
MSEQKCPICEKVQQESQRYPHYLCAECVDLATDETGVQVKVINSDLMGTGIQVLNKETEAKTNVWLDEYERAKVFVKGVPCYAQEAHFGGIVIQPVKTKQDN